MRRLDFLRLTLLAPLAALVGWKRGPLFHDIITGRESYDLVDLIGGVSPSEGPWDDPVFVYDRKFLKVVGHFTAEGEYTSLRPTRLISTDELR